MADWQTMMTPSSMTSPSPAMPTHVCRWQNCHQIFHSMPDLLAHVAAFHLGAPGFAPGPAASASAQPQQDLPLPLFDLNTLVFPDPAQTEQAHLFSSCLWDDCLPIPECTAPEPETCQTHQAHVHNNMNGEPFTSQTMLRHVVQEHLGVPGEIFWGPEPVPPVIPATIDKAQSKLHHHRHHQIQLPTPSPSTPSPPPAKSLVCLWPGCTDHQPFPNPSTLMDHLAEVHIGKGKDSYACLWDGCGGESGRSFRSRQKVLRHLQSHTGHRPFVCEVCEQAFSEAAPLAAHMRRHAKESEWIWAFPEERRLNTRRAVQVRLSRLREDVCDLEFAHYTYGTCAGCRTSSPSLIWIADA